MVNRELPHVFVLPEDRANLQVATGFHLSVDWNLQRQMQVLQVAGGWREVLRRFNNNEVHGMDTCPCRYMVLLLDFDRRQDRLDLARAEIPARLAERVFILGTLTEPEDLKRAGFGNYEAIGSALATDCREDTATTWGHDLLQHNATELDRLREHVRPILF